MSKENAKLIEISLLNNLNSCLRFRLSNCFGFLTPLSISSTPLFSGISEDSLLSEVFDCFTAASNILFVSSHLWEGFTLTKFFIKVLWSEVYTKSIDHMLLFCQVKHLFNLLTVWAVFF